MYKLELGKKMVGGNKKKRVKKVEVGGLAIILTGTESHSNLNVAKHCRTRLGFLVSQHYISKFTWFNSQLLYGTSMDKSIP